MSGTTRRFSRITYVMRCQIYDRSRACAYHCHLTSSHRCHCHRIKTHILKVFLRNGENNRFKDQIPRPATVAQKRVYIYVTKHDQKMALQKIVYVLYIVLQLFYFFDFHQTRYNHRRN